MFDRARVGWLVAVLGVVLVGGASLAKADPGDDDVPKPGLVTAAASCVDGKAAIQVWVDDDRDDPIPVRLDQLRRGDATLTKDTVFDDDRGMHAVVFEPVPVGDYNVHVDRGKDKRPDDVPVAVLPCEDPPASDEVLRVDVECHAGWGIARYHIVDPKTGKPASYFLNTDGLDLVTLELRPGLFLEVSDIGYDDGDYIAKVQLDDAPKPKDRTVVARKEFTVACAFGNPPDVKVTTACANTAGTATVGVLNPNRGPLTYTVKLKDKSKDVAVKGGEQGTVSFEGLPAGEYPVTVSLGEKIETATVVKVECGTTPTTPPTTTTPEPQGRTTPELADTGANVGGLIGFGVLVLGLGAGLLMIGRRRAHGR